MSDFIDIQPVDALSVQRSMRGKMVAVEDDVQGIAKQLREIDSSLHLTYDPAEDNWIVFQKTLNQSGELEEKLVTVMQGDLDHRLLHRVRQVTSPGYDLVAELDAEDARRDRQNDHRRREQVGPVAERLAHALRQDLGHKNRAFIGGR